MTAALDTFAKVRALPANILRRMLRSAVERLLPDDALEVARAAEESERALIGRLSDLCMEERGNG